MIYSAISLSLLPTLDASYLIYSESFTDQDGKGVYGPVPTLDLDGVGWDLNFTYASLTASEDYAKVVDEMLEFHDVDGVVSFESPFANTTGFSNFFIEFELSESGDHEGTDIIEAFYTLDGGISHTSMGSRSGNFSDDNITDTFIIYINEGDSIGIRVDAINNADGEYLRLDDLTIRSETLNGATFEVNGSNLSGFSDSFEIYSGEFFLADQINFDQNITVSSNYMTFYEEDFGGENGKGTSGNSSDLSELDWNISAPASLTDQYDYLKVIELSGNEIFEFRDLGGTGSWISPEINASLYESTRILMELTEVGAMESSDQIKVEYSMDGGSSFTAITTQTGDFASYDVNYSLPNSESLIFQLSAINSADDEKHRFDNIVVQGLTSATIGENVGGTSEFSGNIEINRPLNLKASELGRVTISGKLSGNEKVTKQGSGIVNLANPSSTYSGNIIIEEGKLELSSGVSFNGTVSADGNQKTVIGGDGTVSSVSIGSGDGEVDFISPGLGLASSSLSATSLNQFISRNDNGTPNDSSDDALASIGSFTSTSIALNNGGVYDWELRDFDGSNPGSDWDVISFTNLSFGSPESSFTINILPIKSNDGTPGAPDNTSNLWAQHGSSFKFLDGPDGGSGITWGDWSPENINEYFAFRMDEFSYYTDFYYNDWNVAYLNGDFYLNYSAVPEPSTYFMTAGLLLLPSLSAIKRKKGFQAKAKKPCERISST